MVKHARQNTTGSLPQQPNQEEKDSLAISVSLRKRLVTKALRALVVFR